MGVFWSTMFQHCFNIENKVRTSIKITYNAQRISADNSVSLFAQVIVARAKKTIALHIRWPADKFDNGKGMCKPRHRNDPDVDDYNMIIRSEVAKINEIFKEYRLRGRDLTIKQFMLEYNTDMTKDDFINYLKNKAHWRKKIEEIGTLTYDNHIRTYNKLKLFAAALPFKMFTEDWAQVFEAFLKAQGMNANSRTMHHKNVKTYMRLARKDSIAFIMPYDNFPLTKIKGSWRPIYAEHLRLLYDFYKGEAITDKEKLVLRRFLFSCATGLRVSDLYRVKHDWLFNGILKFIPHKGRKKGDVQEIPLNNMAMEMFTDALEEKGEGLLMDDLSEQKSNDVLKIIGEKLGIKEKLHHHVGRHTFITMVYSKTKDLLAAKTFAGHADIQQTMTYTHFDRSKMKETMKPMDDMLKD